MFLGHVIQMVVPCSVTNTKYYLGNITCGHYGEVVFKTGLTLVVRALNCKFGSPGFKPTGWLQGKLILSSFAVD